MARRRRRRYVDMPARKACDGCRGRSCDMLPLGQCRSNSRKSGRPRCSHPSVADMPRSRPASFLGYTAANSGLAVSTPANIADECRSATHEPVGRCRTALRSLPAVGVICQFCQPNARRGSVPLELSVLIPPRSTTTKRRDTPVRMRPHPADARLDELPVKGYVTIAYRAGRRGRATKQGSWIFGHDAAQLGKFRPERTAPS